MEMHPWLVTLARLGSQAHAGLYRLLGGSGFLNRNTLVLITRGRKTGRETPAPLLYVADGERLYVVASFGGSDTPPGWYRNLLVHPEVQAEVGGTTRRYHARPLAEDEAKPIWPRLLAIWPAYETYQKRTTRVIPIVELTPS